MHDPLAVRGRESLRELQAIVQRGGGRDRPFLEALPQCLSVQQLGDDVRRAFVRPDVVDVEDVRMVERGGGATFLLESAQLDVVVLAGREHLDGHLAVELQVESSEDAAHPAAPELPQRTIAASQARHALGRAALHRIRGLRRAATAGSLLVVWPERHVCSSPFKLRR